jgi:hypothetical protein
MKASKAAALLLLAAGLLFLGAAPAVAQEPDTIAAGDFGFTFYTGLPFIGDNWLPGGEETVTRYFGIGAAYHPLPFLRISPGLFYMRQRVTEKDKLTGDEYDQEDDIGGASLGVFYSHDIGDGLSFYAGPRVEYLHQSSWDHGESGKGKTKQSNIGAIAVFGLQHSLARRLAVFADMGIGYYWYSKERTWRDTSNSVTSKMEDVSNEIAVSRGTVGLIFYLVKS